MKVVLYCRVSTEEQAKHGLSIDTQLDNLRQWAQQNGHTVVAEYVDAGISGKKPYPKRPALNQLMQDLEAGMQIDAMVFTKLDRFFRSVKHYYQAVSVLDKYRVGWQAIQEDYETLTSAGRFKVNIMLSVAEAEADRTSERIKVVLEAKRQRKECVTGHVPIGYKLDGKRIVVDDEQKAIPLILFEEYARTGSVKAASDVVEEKTGRHLFYRNASDMLKNPSYYGCFYGIDDYAPALISKADFDRVAAMRRKVTRRSKHDEIYLFSGLLVCGECGGSMSPRTQHDRKIPPSVYNCRARYEKRVCGNRVNIDERTVETYLLETVSGAFVGYRDEAKKLDPDVGSKIAALKRKREKLTDLYLADLLTLDEVKRQKADIDAQLATLSAPQRDTTALESILTADWRTAYDSVGKAEKKAFWRSVLSEIRVFPDRHMEYDFL